MITNLPVEDLVRFGSRYRGADLSRQAAYTLPLARVEAALSDYLPSGTLEEVETVAKGVETALKNKALVAQETVDPALVLGALVRSAKVWRRRLIRIVEGASLAHPELPMELRKAGRLGSEASRLAKSIASRLELADKFRSALASFGVKPRFLDEGKQLLIQLKRFDPKEESQRLKKVTEPQRDFYRDKGALYLGLKLITSAGQALHVDDLQAAARFNLNLLYESAKTSE